MRTSTLAIVAALSAAIAAPTSAATVLVGTNANLASAPFTFDIQGVQFTFGTSGRSVTVQNGVGGAVQAFGGFSVFPLRPSSSFTNRGTVTYGPTGTQFASFLTPTINPTATQNSFIGLRATVGSDNFFGFAFLTNSVLNGYGFETTPNAAITATTAVAAVPEPQTWAMMLIGFGAVGASMRYRRKRPAVFFA